GRHATPPSATQPEGAPLRPPVPGPPLGLDASTGRPWGARGGGRGYWLRPRAERLGGGARPPPAGADVRPALRARQELAWNESYCGIRHDLLITRAAEARPHGRPRAVCVARRGRARPFSAGSASLVGLAASCSALRRSRRGTGRRCRRRRRRLARSRPPGSAWGNPAASPADFVSFLSHDDDRAGRPNRRQVVSSLSSFVPS